MPRLFTSHAASPDRAHGGGAIRQNRDIARAGRDAGCPPAGSRCAQYGVTGLDGGIFKRREDVLLFKIGIVFEDFLMSGARAEQSEHVADANPQSADAGPRAALVGSNGNTFEVRRRHGRKDFAVVMRHQAVARQEYRAGRPGAPRPRVA